MGGYNFLDITADRFTPHPGVDLNARGAGNADCGLPVYAAVHGWVRYIEVWNGRTSGSGNHIWIEIDDAVPAYYPPANYNPLEFLYTSSYAHYCHLEQGSIQVKLNQEVFPDTQIGRCGRTGGWPACHLHFEIMRHAPSNYNTWPTRQSKANVALHYANPFAYLAEYVPAYARVPIEPPDDTPEPILTDDGTSDPDDV
jgi:murein DD-endopeptidase MepM/ murein hydrolase activator NlpD